MKSLFWGCAIFASLSSSLSALGDPMKCHPLKYDSYFVTQNLKDGLKHTNPNLTEANFDQKYLLLRAELAMETLYLIASCETGEFYHEKLSDDLAVFSLDSAGVELSGKKTTTHYEWDGKSWVKGETHDLNAVVPTLKTETPGAPPANASISPAAPAKSTLLASYDSLFAKYPAQDTSATCATLDFSSNFRAEQNKASILKNTPDLTHPNFAGTKILIQIESLFETMTLIADCKTGKFGNGILKGHLTSRPSSRLAMLSSSDSRPKLYVWSDNEWIQIPDPERNHAETISNTLHGTHAEILVKELPNPKHLDVLRFEHLKNTESLKPLFAELAADEITSGKCQLPVHQTPVCDVETK